MSNNVFIISYQTFFQDMDWSEIFASSETDDIPRHSAVSQHPENKHKHQVYSIKSVWNHEMMRFSY